MTRVVAAVVALVSAALLVAAPAEQASARATAASACAGPGGVRFRASDGTRLYGRRFGRGTTAVVLAHQYRADLCQWVSYARRLAAHGYLVFAFDFRNYGRSEQVGYARAGRLAGDVAAAARYVRSKGAKKVLLVGATRTA